jgi:ribosomal protein S18 acetylase RimI-like enzyme
MATNLRRATLADAATIRDLTRLAYAKWVPLIGREPKPMTVNYDRAVVDHMIDLYEVDGEAVALVEVVPQAQHLLIENIAVRPDHQGRKIGDLLLSHAELLHAQFIWLNCGFTQMRRSSRISNFTPAVDFRNFIVNPSLPEALPFT